MWLRVRQLLWKFGIVQERNRLICDTQEESINHLFFGCSYSQKCLQDLFSWLGWKCYCTGIEDVVHGLQKAKLSIFRKRVLYAAVAALVYNLWRTRNEVLWLSKLWLVSNTVKRVKLDVQMRVKVVMPKKVSKSDREWFRYVGTQWIVI